MSSMLIKWLRLTQELKENPGCYNNRGFYFPPRLRMLTKSWDYENAPAAMMMGKLKGRHLSKFIRFQMIADNGRYSCFGAVWRAQVYDDQGGGGGRH